MASGDNKSLGLLRNCICDLIVEATAIIILYLLLIPKKIDDVYTGMIGEIISSEL